MWLSCFYFLKMFCLSTKLDPLGLERSLCALEEQLFLFKGPELDSQHATAHNQDPVPSFDLHGHLTHTLLWELSHGVLVLKTVWQCKGGLMVKTEVLKLGIWCTVVYLCYRLLSLYLGFFCLSFASLCSKSSRFLSSLEWFSCSPNVTVKRDIITFTLRVPSPMSLCICWNPSREFCPHPLTIWLYFFHGQ